MAGTFNVSRDLWDDPAFRDQPFTDREAWVWMLAEAEWRPRERRVGSVTVNLTRGQFAASLRFLAERWQWSKSAVSRFLDRLAKRDMIEKSAGTGVYVVTLCKYDEYQTRPRESGTAAGQGAGQNRDSTDTQSGTAPERATPRKKKEKPAPEIESGTAPGHDPGQQRDSSGTNLSRETGKQEEGDARGARSHSQPDLLGESDPKPEAKKAKPDPVGILIEVEGVTEDLARDFVQHRKSIKKPLTDLAARRIAQQLHGFDDPVASLDASIANGWTGVFARTAGSGPPGGGGRPAQPGPGRGILNRLNRQQQERQ